MKNMSRVWKLIFRDLKKSVKIKGYFLNFENFLTEIF